MLGKKHVNDYTLEVEQNEKGKIIERPKYIGPLFQLDENVKNIEKLKKEILILHTASWLILWPPLMYYSQITHITYIVMSYALLCIVLLFQLTSVYGLFRIKFPCKRAEKEKIHERFMGSLVIELFFLLWTAGASVLAKIAGKYELISSNVIFLVAVIALFILACLKFKLGNQMKFKEII